MTFKAHMFLTVLKFSYCQCTLSKMHLAEDKAGGLSKDGKLKKIWERYENRSAVESTIVK